MSENEFIYNTESINKVGSEPKIELYELVNEYNEVLNHRTTEFNFEVDDAVTVASRLIETAKKYNLYNLSANQCGLNYRLFVAGSGNEYVAFFNPTILSYDGEDVIMSEVDANIPALQLKVKRPEIINIKYIDYNGEEKSAVFSGLTSRLLQQSYDRINGVSFCSKVSSFVLDRALKSQNKKIKKYVRAVMSQHKIN